MLRYRALVAVALAAMLFSPALAATVSVMDFGAKADGVADDTAAFRKALDEAAKTSGSTAFAPSGRYLIAGTVTVPANTTLKGEYSGPGRQGGTVLLATGGKGVVDGKGLLMLAGGSCVRNIAVEYPEQSAESKEPVPYPYAITAAGCTRIEDVFLYNAYQGINLDGAHANMVRNVWGEPLAVGINSDHTYDISRIENVHFWPYFTLNKPLRNWVQAKGVAFQFGRSDWQYCFNTFCYGYHIGYRFFTSQELKTSGYPGGTTNGNFVGIGADCCGIALDIEDSFAIGVSITNGEFAPFGGTNTRGVLLHKGNTGNVTLTNCSFWAVTDTLAEVQSGSLNLTACNIHEWGVVKKDAPCFALTGGRLNVNGCTFNKGGFLASLDGPDSRALFANNMGAEPLEVTSAIGERAVFGVNNPAILVVNPAKQPAGAVNQPSNAKP